MDALTKFKAAAKKSAEDLGKILAAEKSSDKFTVAVTKFQKAMKDFSGVQRVDQQIVKLQEAEKNSTAG